MNKRAIAPKVKVKARGYRDTRAEMLVELNEANPEYVYSYQDARVTERDLTRFDQEIVRDEKGETLKWREDIIVRKSKELYDEEREQSTEESASLVESLYSKPADGEDGNMDWKDNSPGRRVASPKSQDNVNNYGGM